MKWLIVSSTERNILNSRKARDWKILNPLYFFSCLIAYLNWKKINSEFYPWHFKLTDIKQSALFLPKNFRYRVSVDYCKLYPLSKNKREKRSQPKTMASIRPLFLFYLLYYCEVVLSAIPTMCETAKEKTFFPFKKSNCYDAIQTSWIVIKLNWLFTYLPQFTFLN